MKTLSTIMAVTALTLGSAGGALAYTTTSAGTPPAPYHGTSPTPAADSPSTKPAAQIRTRFRPCKGGARLEHGKCVRHVVRTVVVAAPPAPVVVAAPPAPVAVAASATRNRSENQRGSGGHQATQDHDARPGEDQVSKDQAHDGEQEHGEDREVPEDD